MQNFLMDFVAVTGVNIFLKRYRKSWKLFFAALLTSGLGLLCLLWLQNDTWYQLITHFILNTFMLLLCFGKCSKKEFLENWAVTYLVVMILGGMLQWMTNCGLISSIFLARVTVAVFGGYGVLLYLMKKRNFSNHLYLVKLKKGNRCLEVRAYWDSGNQLQDPYTGQGVSILSGEKAHWFFDAAIDRVRYVPYCALGENNGLLGVYTVDELELYDGNKIMRHKQMAVGIAEAGLLEGKEYDLILHASLL